MAGFFGRSLRCALIGVAAFAAAFPAAAACQLGKYLDLPVTMRGRRPIVAAQIGGKDAQFILDSGAFFSNLSHATAAQFGLELRPLPPNLRIQGIGGMVDAQMTTVHDFRVGGVTFPSMDFTVGGTDMGQIGLIGQNFLHVGDVEYDLPHGAVRLFKASGCEPGQLAYWAGKRPVTMLKLLPAWSPVQTQATATVLVNGVKLTALFDSGAPISLLTQAAARKAGLGPDSPGVVHSGNAGGLGSQTTPAYLGTFASIDIGGELIRSPKIRFADVRLGLNDMLIGADFFLTHRIYVSNATGRMFVTYEGGPLFGLAHGGEVTSTGERVDLTDTSAAPTDADGFARRGAVAMSNGRPADAVDDFNQAIALAPNEARYVRQRAAARLAMHQPLLAVADLDEALNLDAKDIDAHGMRASIRLAAHEMDGALEDLRALDTLLPPTAAQRLTLAGLAAVAGQHDMAIANYSAWLDSHREDGERPAALGGRCRTRAIANRDLEAALADCNAALKLRPKDARLSEARALVRFRQGDFKAARADYDAALGIDPKLGWALYMRGLAKVKLGDAAGASADRDAALAIDKGAPERARKLGLEG